MQHPRCLGCVLTTVACTVYHVPDLVHQCCSYVSPACSTTRHIQLSVCEYLPAHLKLSSLVWPECLDLLAYVNRLQRCERPWVRPGMCLTDMAALNTGTILARYPGYKLYNRNVSLHPYHHSFFPIYQIPPHSTPRETYL